MWILTNANRSKLRGNQRTGAKLVIRRNWRTVEKPVRTTRLELGGSSGRRGGAGAHGRLREENRDDFQHIKHKRYMQHWSEDIPGQWQGPEGKSMLV